MLAILGLCWWDVGPFMLKTSSETTFYEFFRPSKQKLWKNQRFLTSPRCNSAPPKGPKPCKKRCFWTQGAKSTVNYRVFWQNRAMYNVFFIFGRFSLAGKLPKRRFFCIGGFCCCKGSKIMGISIWLSGMLWFWSNCFFICGLVVFSFLWHFSDSNKSICHCISSLFLRFKNLLYFSLLLLPHSVSFCLANSCATSDFSTGQSVYIYIYLFILYYIHICVHMLFIFWIVFSHP